MEVKEALLAGMREREERAKLEASAEVLQRCVRKYRIKPINQRQRLYRNALRLKLVCLALARVGMLGRRQSAGICVKRCASG